MTLPPTQSGSACPSNPTHTHSLKSSSIPTSNLATKIPEYPMFHCLLTDERFWGLLSKETDGRKVTTFISTNFKLRLPLATPRVWAQIASDARLRDRFIKILSERPNLVVGWVQVTSMERKSPALSAEIVRLFMMSLDRPHRSIRADLAASLDSPELRQALANAAKRLAADAQICVSPGGALAPMSLSREPTSNFRRWSSLNRLSR